MACGSVLVTGANRGIGLEFVKQIVRSETPPRYVFATYRNENTTQALKKIAESPNQCQVILIQLDVTKKEDVQSMRKVVEQHVGEDGLNLLINNAGALRHGGLAEVTEEDMLFHFETNTVGPVTVLKEMLPLLQKAVESKVNILNLSRTTVLNIASMLGSITYLEIDSYFLEQIVAYKTSKAALNMAMRIIAFLLKDRDVLVVNMHPGWVNTDMGSSVGDAEIDVTESVTSMLDTFPSLDKSRQGDLMDEHGKAIEF